MVEPLNVEICDYFFYFAVFDYLQCKDPIKFLDIPKKEIFY